MAKSGFHSTVVTGSGPKDAKIYLIGEGPGREEESAGEPFVGPAGRELDRMLGAAGIERRDCYIDNITQRRPYGDKHRAFFPNGRDPSDTYAQGILNIRSLLQEHKPNVVVAFGQYALWGLTLLDSISKWRGSILDSILVPGQKVIPTLHPAYIMRGQWVMRNPVIWDLQKARGESQSREIETPEYDWTIAGRTGNMPLQMAVEEILDRDHYVVDIETFGGKNLACVGFGLDRGRAIVIPHTGLETQQIYRTLLENDKGKILQNAMFDYTFLACAYGIVMRNITWDTMLASHTLFPDLPKGLDFLCSVYTKQPYYKDEGKIWRKTADLDRFWHYNAIDCCVEFAVYEEQQKDVDEYKVRDTAEFMTSLVEPYGHATIAGMAVDRHLMNQMRSEAEVQAAEVQGVLEGTIGRPINVRSPDQVKDLIYNQLKLPKRVKHGKLTTEKKVLLDLAAKTGSPELNAVVKIRELMKFGGDFCNDRILDSDGRFRASFNIGGTGFSRLSSSATVWGAGTNQQNFPDRARKFVIPDKGMSFLVLDLMQAEAVVVAFDAQDELEIGWFEQQLDSHRQLAALIFNKDPDDVTDEERFIAKQCHHALNYMMGPHTFALTVNKYYQETQVSIDNNEASALRQKYILLRPMLPRWWETSSLEVKTTGKLTTVIKSEFQPNGRTRWFMERWSEKLMRQILDFKPQATVGDACHHLALRYWQSEEMQELRRDGMLDLLNQLHDGITFQIADELIDDVAPKLAEMGLVRCVTHGREFYIPIEGKVGKAWNKKSLGDYNVWREPSSTG